MLVGPVTLIVRGDAQGAFETYDPVQPTNGGPFQGTGGVTGGTHFDVHTASISVLACTYTVFEEGKSFPPYVPV